MPCYVVFYVVRRSGLRYLKCSRVLNRAAESSSSLTGSLLVISLSRIKNTVRTTGCYGHRFHQDSGTLKNKGGTYRSVRGCNLGKHGTGTPPSCRREHEDYHEASDEAEPCKSRLQPCQECGCLTSLGPSIMFRIRYRYCIPVLLEPLTAQILSAQATYNWASID